MGYRSQVVLAIRKEVFLDKGGIIKGSIRDVTSVKVNSDFYILYWESVKWYEHYDDVKAIDEFMESIDMEDYEFVLIGEEEIETRGYADSGVYATFNFPKSKKIKLSQIKFKR